MERPHSLMALEAKVVIEAHRGMAYQHRRHFPILLLAPVCEIDPRIIHREAVPAMPSDHSPVPYGKEPELFGMEIAILSETCSQRLYEQASEAE